MNLESFLLILELAPEAVEELLLEEIVDFFMPVDLEEAKELVDETSDLGIGGVDDNHGDDGGDNVDFGK